MWNGNNILNFPECFLDMLVQELSVAYFRFKTLQGQKENILSVAEQQVKLYSEHLHTVQSANI